MLYELTSVYEGQSDSPFVGRVNIDVVVSTDEPDQV